jgi:hypothetical protein
MIKRVIGTLLAVLALSGTCLFATASPASASSWGSVNVSRYCSYNYGLQAYDPFYGAYNWSCGYWTLEVKTGGTWKWVPRYGVDMNLACRQQYGAGAYAYLVEPRTGYSWFCFQPN